MIRASDFNFFQFYGDAMKRAIIAGLIFFVAGISFAGDAAAFKDIGFSDDGKIYVFGQYGMTDVKFRPYAEIYVVDVEKNEYVPGGVFKKVEAKSDKNGKAVYDNLFSARYSSGLAKYGCAKTSSDDTLYVMENESKDGTEKISFKEYGDEDSLAQSDYNVRLVPTFEGAGQNCKSSFYIDLSIKNFGTEKKYKVGSPDIKRAGVTGYKIVRIFRNAQRNALVFVVEKTVEDQTGTSIRYMVETVKL